MLAAERMHRLRADRDWLPSRVRNSGRVVTGAVWGGAAVAAVGAVIAAPAMLILWKAMLLGGAGIAVLGERAGRAVLQRQLARMASGQLELAELMAREEGELVVVRGTVHVAVPLRGLLIDAQGVYRRLIFSARGTWVHEAAIDFDLLDESGHRIAIQGAGARWIVPGREAVSYPGHLFAREHIPPRMRKLVQGRTAVEAFEQVLEVGEQVQIVGYKSTTPDPGGEFGDYRSPPRRATLCSGPDLPLVITRISDLA